MIKINTFLLLLFGLAPLCAQSPLDTDRQVDRASKTEHLAGLSTRPDSTIAPLIWRVRDRVLKTGQTLNVDFLAFGFTDIAAYQFALKFNPFRLRFESIEVLSPDLPIDPDNNFGLFNIANGEIRTLWSASQGFTLPAATPVFRLVFTTLAGGQNLSETLILDPGVLTPVAYNTLLVPKDVQLYYADYTKPADPRAENTGAATLQLYANYPNPFSDCTTIGFAMPGDGLVRFRLLDATGRERLSWEKTGAAGYQEAVICPEDAPAGLLFCELATPYGKAIRRLLKMQG